MKVTTNDGRQLSYRSLGTGTRRILFFYGFPGSSVQIELFRAHAETAGLTVVSIDRPGTGRTSVGRADQLEQCALDARHVLATEGWDRCEVVTVSGGTPFGLTFAKLFPESVSRVTVISGLGPLARRDFRGLLRGRIRFALRLLRWLPGGALAKLMPADAADAKGSRLSASLLEFFLPVSRRDLEATAEPDVQHALTTSLAESFAQNGQGPRRDARAYLCDWGWRLEEFPHPATFWHGDEDLSLPVEMARKMAASVPGGTLTIVPGEGHYSLAITNLAKILGPG